MKTKLITAFFATIAASGLISCESDESGKSTVSPNDFTTIPLTDGTRAQVENERSFGFSLFRTHVAASQENEALSPLSVYMTLAMTANCEENSPEALLAILGSDGGSQSIKDINALCASLLTSLPKVDNQTICKFANSLWSGASLPFSPDALAILQNDFNADLVNQSPAGTNGMDAINNWVSNATNRMIPQILKNPLDGEIAWINATYFNGKWSEPFEKALTTAGTFNNAAGTTSITEFMNKVETLSYFEDENLQLVSLPYGNGNFVMDVILPTEKSDIVSVMEGMTPESYREILKYSQYTDVTLMLPKFELTCSTDLMETLAKMGYTPSPQATVKLGSLTHGVNIKVEEEGTVAAAATIVEGTSGNWFDKVTMNCNHPFAFIIREVSTDAVLYIGRIVKF